jgi:epoxyqueuosine reductase
MIPSSSFTPHAAAAAVKAFALEGGFDLVGIARAAPSSERDAAAYRGWIAAGKHGSMDYLARNLEERTDITRKFPWAQSVVCVALAYYQEAPAGEAGTDGPTGKIARYAWGRDYHKLIESKLKGLEKRMRGAFDAGRGEEMQARGQAPGEARGRGEKLEIRTYCDTGPIPERELAARAGLGWIGKNTLLLHPRHGSYFLLGELVTSLELEPDEPLANHCGTCTRCIEACPTDAITPWSVDATRCISYHTLELRTPAAVPEAFHAAMQRAGYLVGCDICQEVCPFNRRPLVTREADFAVRSPAPAMPLEQVLAWQEQEWDILTRGRAHRRAKHEMWRRNARILMGSRPEELTTEGTEER